MKLFYKKDYEMILKGVIRLIGENKELNKELNSTLIECEKAELRRKKSAGKVGGLSKENNTLKLKISTLEQELEETKNKLKESITDKYLVKKIPPGRTPNLNKMKASKVMSGNVRNYMKKEFDYDK